MSRLFDEIKQGLEEATQHASGEPSRVRVRSEDRSLVTAERGAQPETAHEARACDAAQAITKAG
jgi:hypothetical protein